MEVSAKRFLLENEVKTLSVIVPVYNVASFLSACLDSILQQTGFELEVILVDDGSSDRSGVICDEYGRRDSRVHVLHLPNGGVSNARNTGIAHATGEFIAFVDSDDTLAPNAYQVCADYLSEHAETDCLIFGYTVIKNGRVKPIIPHAGNYAKEAFGSAYTELLLSFLINSPVNKIYRKDVLISGGAVFPLEMALGEDLLFNNRYLMHCQQISVLDRALYNYFHRDNGSLTTRYHADLFNVYCRHYESIKETLAFFGVTAIDPRISALFYGYAKEAVNMTGHPKCPLSMFQKYREIRRIVRHPLTQAWCAFAKRRDFYWRLMRKQCALGLLAYIWGAKLKGRLR